MKYLLLAIMMIILFSCSQQETVPGEPPSKVRLVQRTAGTDTTDTETGIDAAESPGSKFNAIQIMWHSNPETELQGYKIYRSSHESGLVNYILAGMVEQDQNGNLDTIYIDTQDLTDNVRYYYYVTAVSRENLESENSDTASYKLIEKATNLGINGQLTEIRRLPVRFQWSNESGYTPAKYILRIEAYVDENFHPIQFIDMFEPAEYVQPQTYELSDSATMDSIPNGIYRWRVDCVGEAYPKQNYYSGSESDWSNFTINWE